MSTSFRLCSLAPSSRIFCPVPRRLRRRHRNRQFLPQVFRRQRSRLVHQPSSVPENTTRPPCSPAPRPEIDDVIGDLDHVGVVLDDQHRVALVAELAQDVDEPQVVARVQPDRRLIEHVQRADERRAERRRQIDALRLAARERRRQTVERQIVEPDVAQERQPPADLPQHLARRSRASFSVEVQRREERLRFADRERRHAIDRAARRPARRAPRAAAARRRSRGTSGSRGTG